MKTDEELLEEAKVNVKNLSMLADSCLKDIEEVEKELAELEEEAAGILKEIVEEEEIIELLTLSIQQ